MKTALSIAVILIAACAGSPEDELSGRHEKNGTVSRVERLGVATTSMLPGELECPSKQLKWCSRQGGDRGDDNSCECIHVREAEDRYRSLAARWGRTGVP